jgi:hypothetical protein
MSESAILHQLRFVTGDYFRIADNTVRIELRRDMARWGQDSAFCNLTNEQYWKLEHVKSRTKDALTSRISGPSSSGSARFLDFCGANRSRRSP